MEETLVGFVDIGGRYGPIGLGLMLVLSSFGFPFPKTLVLVVGGILGGADKGNSLLLFLGCSIGLHTGDFLLFLIGRQWGEDVFSSPRVQRVASPVYVDRARSFIKKYGAASLLMARITPFVRTPCYILLGSLRMSPLRFTLINYPASVAYSAVFFGIGYVIGNHPERIRELIQSGNLVFVIAALLLIGLLVWKPDVLRQAFRTRE